MTIGELKKIVADLPDDTPVVYGYVNGDIDAIVNLNFVQAFEHLCGQGTIDKDSLLITSDLDVSHY